MGKGATTDRKQTEAELKALHDGALTTLMHLARAYDTGAISVAFSMATEIIKVLTTTYSARERKHSRRRFTTPIEIGPTTGPTPLHKIVHQRVFGPPPAIEFVPAYKSGLEPEVMEFRDWWNRDLIYRASASPPGYPPGSIPLRREDWLPIDKRPRLTRRLFIDLVRNKFGAHLDENVPEELDRCLRTNMMGFDFQMTYGGKLYSTSDGSMPVVCPPAAAMVRQIAEEVLRAYDVEV
jgi:hypothetical protein